MTYDGYGNINRLERTDSNGSMMHNIRYNYEDPKCGYRVSSVQLNNTTSGTFQYDASGNLTYDPLNKLTIGYNDIGMLSSVRTENNADNIRYVYSGSGEKLATITNNWETLHCRTMTYAKSGNTVALQQIQSGVGFVAVEGNGYMYKYTAQDHIGSIRAVYSIRKNSPGNYTGAVDQATDYYPYGLPFAYNNLHHNKRLYAGKEYQDAITSLVGAVHMLDFGSRNYNAVLGRWFNIDPAVQLINPYLFNLNNPVMFVNPDGEFIFPLLIGIGAGMISGWKVGKAKGASGWGMFGYIMGGGAIGGLAGYASFGLSSLGVGATGAGIVGNIVNGVGFAAMSGGDIGDAIGYGMLAGGIGGAMGGIGNLIGGRVGAGVSGLASGLAKGVVGMAANNGGGSNIWKSALFSAGGGYLAYEATSILNWSLAGGRKWGAEDASYRWHMKAQRTIIRGRAIQREVGIKEDPDTNEITMSKRGQHRKHTLHDFQSPSYTGKQAHVHWFKEGIYVVHDSDWNEIKFDENYKDKESDHHGRTIYDHADVDFAKGPTYVINRFDVSYHPGHLSGPTLEVGTPITPPILRYYPPVWF